MKIKISVIKTKLKRVGSFFDNKSNIIQSVCSLISVFAIGFVSVLVSIKANNIAKKESDIANKQLQVSIAENIPVISFTLKNNDNGENIMEINNEGVAPISYNVDVVTFFTFLNSENHFGKEMTNIYAFGNDSYTLQEINDGKGKLAKLSLMGFENEFVKDINNGVQKLVNKYNDGLWQTEFIYIIRVECVDVFEQHHYTYIMYDGFNGNILTQEFGEQLVEEWEFVSAGLHQDDYKNEPDHFVIRYNAATPELLLENAVKYLRAKDLYAMDIDGKICTYGEFEPN